MFNNPDYVRLTRTPSRTAFIMSAPQASVDRRRHGRLEHRLTCIS